MYVTAYQNLQAVREFAPLWFYFGGLCALLGGVAFAWRTRRPSRQKYAAAMSFGSSIVAFLLSLKFMLLLNGGGADPFGPVMYLFVAFAIPAVFWLASMTMTDWCFGSHILGRGEPGITLNDKRAKK